MVRREDIVGGSDHGARHVDRVLLKIIKFDVKFLAREEVKRGISGVYGLASKRQTLAAPCMAALKLPQICRDHITSAFVSLIILPLIG